MTDSDRILERLLASLTAVHDGDLTARLPDDAEGLPGEIAAVYDRMVERLSLVASEVTRVAQRSVDGDCSADTPGSRAPAASGSGSPRA